MQEEVRGDGERNGRENEVLHQREREREQANGGLGRERGGGENIRPSINLLLLEKRGWEWG